MALLAVAAILYRCNFHVRYFAAVFVKLDVKVKLC